MMFLHKTEQNPSAYQKTVIAKAGKIATRPKNKDPGKVILDIIESKYSDVAFPGFTPE